MADRTRLAVEIVAASRALHARGWVANHDGNVSVRLGPDRLLVTPTATSKGVVTEGGLALTDGKGAPLDGEAKPPGEFALHVLGCYAVRDDVHAVVHAHPPHATALACAGRGLDVFLAEAVVSLGATIPLAPPAPPGGAEGAAPIAALAPLHDAILLAGHGVITLGGCVEQAMLRMELVEHLARIHALALPLGGVKPLPDALVRDLLGKRRAAASSLGAAAARAGKEAAPEPPAASAGLASLPPAPTWTPAGPAPAPDAWSGGRTEGACGAVYGAVSAADLASAVRAEVARTLGKS